MTPIVDLQRRLYEVGRIRVGQRVPTDRGGTRPARLDTFRITSQDRRALDRVAELYGGIVERWDGGVGEQWEVVTDTAELPVAVPPERMALSQWMELWSGGGCIRRCDGVRQDNDEPCVCAQLDDSDPAPRCSRHTRLSLMLADLPTSGLWRLDTQSFYASVELAGSFELLQIVAAATGRALIPGWLRLDQRESSRAGEQTKRYAVPVLALEMPDKLLGPSQAADPVPQALTNGEGTHESSAGLTPIPVEASTLADELQAVNHPRATEAETERRRAAAAHRTAEADRCRAPRHRRRAAARRADQRDDRRWEADRSAARDAVRAAERARDDRPRRAAAVDEHADRTGDQLVHRSDERGGLAAHRRAAVDARRRPARGRDPRRRPGPER